MKALFALIAMALAACAVLVSDVTAQRRMIKEIDHVYLEIDRAPDGKARDMINDAERLITAKVSRIVFLPKENFKNAAFEIKCQADRLDLAKDMNDRLKEKMTDEETPLNRAFDLQIKKNLLQYAEEVEAFKRKLEYLRRTL